jgi:hypothetical protein
MAETSYEQWAKDRREQWLKDYRQQNENKKEAV